MHLVTGGAGFIGSHVIDRLIARGEPVVCLDDFDDFYDPSLKRRNIAGYLKHPLFTLIEGDLRDERLVASVFDKYPLRKAIHLAARVGVRASVQDPELYEDVNVRGTSNLLRHASKKGLEQFIFASSSSVYGTTDTIPFREDNPPGEPCSPYAAAKFAAETLCRACHDSSGLPISVLRFFSVYGPRLRPDMAIHRFVRAIREGRAIPMFGEGTMGRDYTYVDDIVDGLLASLNTPFPFEIFNLGNGSCVRLLEVVSELERICGQEIRIDELPLQRGDVEQTCADVSKAKAMLGYNPSIRIREGLEKFVRWFDEQTEKGCDLEPFRHRAGI